MRILCDQNVHDKYVSAFRHDDGITVTTVETALSHDADDTEIVEYAETRDWVVFTSDEDFFLMDGAYGLLVYDQIDDPSPGDVLTAVRRIAAAYESASDVLETVPDGWV
jgi:hypothetical protein